MCAQHEPVQSPYHDDGKNIEITIRNTSVLTYKNNYNNNNTTIIEKNMLIKRV